MVRRGITMKDTAKKIILLLLVICLTTTAFTVSAEEIEEVYLSDIRIIYAKNYEEAVSNLKGTDFDDYKVLNADLNKGTGNIGVWLAYQTTTNIDDAITDISIMQMNGGYKSGNYQEMIAKSFEEYLAFGEIYLAAIDYFATAYEEGDFLAECAYRQMNLYYDEDSGKKMGDLFIEGVSADALATIFMQGNSYALENLRTLLAQGVSYNECGKTYMELVEEAATWMTEDPEVYESLEYEELAVYVSGTIITLRKMFEDLAAVEEELNYEDEEVTEQEIAFLPNMAMAKLARETTYLNGESLYDFCLKYEFNEDELNSLFPMVAALNEGQQALTKVGHHYDVMQCSMSEHPEEYIEEEIKKLEDTYLDFPFNIYEGVDRSIYEGNFAITNEAYRADAVTKEGLLGYLFNKDTALRRGIDIGVAVIGLASLSYGIARNVITARAYKALADRAYSLLGDTFVSSGLFDNGSGGIGTYSEILDDIFSESGLTNSRYNSYTFIQKYNYITKEVSKGHLVLSENNTQILNEINKEVLDTQRTIELAKGRYDASKNIETSMGTITPGMITATMYIISGITMLYTAISIGLNVYDYYHPEYEAIPTALVDIIDTEDGDRYIKYDAVTTVDVNEEGKYNPADLNAFEGQRWNAMYFTKSYEAGKPLLADFAVEYSNMTPGEKYTPVHRFGETVCYNLNKYNYESGVPGVYLSVKQSDKEKTAVKVPPVVGTIVGEGGVIIVACAGVMAGVAAMMLYQKKFNNKKDKAATVKMSVNAK